MASRLQKIITQQALHVKKGAPRKVSLSLTTSFSLLAKEFDMNRKSIDAAKYWVSTAVSYYRAQEKEKSLVAFSNPKGQFSSGDMYVFALNLDGIIIAHGADKRYIGRNFMEISNSKGEKYFQDVISTVNQKGHGIVEYWWTNPSTQRVEPKNVYFEKNDDIIICSGVSR